MVSYQHISNYLFSIMPEMRFPGHVLRVGSDRDSIGDSSDSLHPDIQWPSSDWWFRPLPCMVSANKKNMLGIFFGCYFTVLCVHNTLWKSDELLWVFKACELPTLWAFAIGSCYTFCSSKCCTSLNEILQIIKLLHSLHGACSTCLQQKVVCLVSRFSRNTLLCLQRYCTFWRPFESPIAPFSKHNNTSIE